MIRFILYIVFFLVIIVALMVLHRKSKYPEKSYYNCFLNVALIPMRLFKLGPFKQGKVTIEKAMSYAQKKTKLSDFGNLNFADSYNAIANTKTHQSQKLTNVGYILNRLELNMTMVRRLKFIQYLKDVPAVKQVPVRKPVFVLGLPRTGTTFLHRLLSLDPKVRAPLLWELLAPVPSPKIESSEVGFRSDRDYRAKFVRKLIKDRKSLGDNALAHIHEIGADLPEECLMSLSDEIPVHLSYFYADYLNIDLFFEKIDFNRVVDAYSYYKDILRLLSYQIGENENPRKWMLKCPIHLFYIKEIAKVFPDAQIIWTHRHPVSAVPSLCSLVQAIHKVYYEKECRDDALLGRKLTDLSAYLLERAPKDIKESGLESSNVIYNDLISDPVKMVKSIYKQFGWEYTQEYEAIMLEYLAENKRQRESMKSESGKLHHYTPEEFSITTEELCEGKFKNYIEAFNIPMSKN